jgi:hypothetical protein
VPEQDTRTRLELDLKHLPLGIVPQLEELAAAKGLRPGVYVRTLIIEHVLEKGPDAKAAHS